ncbi:dipeptidyl aminopeptidase/acylaminoacyl peptidase [Sphingopyxis panaciterrae]|uniref:S9 family peptidase n=1 Tax=Sphingopyxis panaciterrae TaxID=363841 RepID=UPI0014238AF2|nr:S9 family peptidase [Sphingopyxis panaciterrae]NIJ39501.1 dipeptidyl aminopeptidase/acylaminoacyl peptidase [Sphingopyxis panaciterrae]
MRDKMRKYLLLGIAMACHAVPALAGEAPSKSYTIEQLMDSDVIGGLSWSPDDKKLIFTSNRTGIANIYEMPSGGGKATALTNSVKETVNAIGYFPADARILFSSDQGGNELAHIYVREPGGTTHDVTPGAKHVARFVEWAQDGKSFFVQTNERDPRYFDLYEIQADGYAKTLLFENDKAYQVRAVSPDRRYVGLSRIVDNATKHCYVYDRNAAKLIQLTAEGKPVACEPQVFAGTRAGTGAQLFYTTDDGGEFAFLVRQDLSTGDRVTVFKPEWDVEGANLSRDGGTLIVSVNADARSRPYLFDAATFKPRPFADPMPGASVGLLLANHATKALVSASNGATPGEILLLDLASGQRTPLLNARAPGVAPGDLVAGEVVRFRSYDGVTVPGILYVPKGAKKGDALPAVIHVHGGPGDESRIGYRPLQQFLANHGYVVFEINNRGSSGSGRTFYHLDDRKHGDADLDDVVAAKKMLAATGYVDPAKVVIQGQSYGGYMTLAGLAFRPDAFAAGVDIYGVSNWPRLLANTPSWWEDLRRLLFTEVGDPAKDAEYLRKISPVFHAENIKKPLLVLQGANDPRVLPVESEDIVARVKANGVPVDYVVFNDEGHGFRKKANQITAYRKILDFLDTHVKRAAAKAPPAEQASISPLGDFPIGQ